MGPSSRVGGGRLYATNAERRIDQEGRFWHIKINPARVSRAQLHPVPSARPAVPARMPNPEAKPPPTHMMVNLENTVCRFTTPLIGPLLCGGGVQATAVDLVLLATAEHSAKKQATSSVDRGRRGATAPFATATATFATALITTAAPTFAAVVDLRLRVSLRLRCFNLR